MFFKGPANLPHFPIPFLPGLTLPILTYCILISHNWNPFFCYYSLPAQNLVSYKLLAWIFPPFPPFWFSYLHVVYTLVLGVYQNDSASAIISKIALISFKPTRLITEVQRKLLLYAYTINNTKDYDKKENHLYSKIQLLSHTITGFYI